MTVARPRPHAVAFAAAIAAGMLVAPSCSSSSDSPTTTSTAGGTSSSSSPTSTTPISSSPGTSSTVPGTVTDPAVPIETRVGETFFITVESNPTTGYTWNVTGNPADSIAVPIGNTPTSTGPLPGQSGTETFEFKASGPGTTTITLTYARSFAPEDDPTVNEYTLVVMR